MLNRALPAGAWFTELTFSNLVMAPKHLVAKEFIRAKLFRVLLDSQGRDLSEKVAANALDSQFKFIDKKQGRILVKQLRREASRPSKGFAEQQQQWLLNKHKKKCNSNLSISLRTRKI